MVAYRTPKQGGKLASGNVGGGRRSGGGARGVSARVVLNRAKIDFVRLTIADGLFEAGKVIVETAAANAPDSPYDPYPTGEGLPKQGGVLAYVDNQKVAGWSQRGGQPKKPRAVRGTTRNRAIAVIAGFGFPARFAELGTIRTPAQPFLTPAMEEVGPRVPRIVGEVARARIGGKG